MKPPVLALQLVLAQNSGVVTVTDSLIRLRADNAIRAFLLEWRSAWQDTQHELWRPINSFDADMRTAAVHCHWSHSAKDPGFRFAGYLSRHIIKGAVAAHAACPMWYPGDPTTIDDERRSIDGGLSLPKRLVIASLRSRVRSFLDSAAQRLPGDLRITRQRVRFALDAGAFRDAWSVAAACTGEQAQCALLQALVLHRGSYPDQADSAFLAAADKMGEDERCAWNDVSVLLHPDEKKAYASLPCARRAELEARLWWLSDPLYSEPGNERRAEHFARKVLVTLLAAFGDDQRQHFTSKKGGDAIKESLLRYGWPSQMHWAGSMVDREHGEWLRNHVADTAPPYVVREYTRDRLHTRPLPAALTSPFKATPDQWQLNAPPKEDDWWPIEHFARDRSSIVQLPVGQTVMLRRAQTTRLVWAGDLDPASLARASGDGIEAMLVQSRAPTEIANAGVFPGKIGHPLIVDAHLQAGEALIGIELPGDSARPAARTRFGVEIPLSLMALSGARAVSEPLLFESQDGTNMLDDSTAVKRMFGTTRLRKMQQLGVYWEAYGFATNDSVDIEVQIEREDKPGIFARVVGAIGLTNTERESVGMHWRELPGEGGRIQIFEGNLAVLMRSIGLDVSRLSPGSYMLSVSISDLRGSAAKSDRRFELH